MPTTTPLQGWPIPLLTDIPNGPAQIQALADAAERDSILNFPDTTTRDATVPNPTDGMICWVGGTRQTIMVYYDGGWNVFAPWANSPGGLGAGPAPVTGKQMFRVVNYGEQATGSDGKFYIDMPNGYTVLVSAQITAANRGTPLLLTRWLPVILTSTSSAAHVHVQGFDLDNTIVNSKFVGYTYDVTLQ